MAACIAMSVQCSNEVGGLSRSRQARQNDQSLLKRILAPDLRMVCAARILLADCLPHRCLPQTARQT